MAKTAHVYPRGKYPSRVLANIRSRSLIDGSLGYVKVHLFTAAAWNAMVAEIKRETGQTIYASGPAGGYRSLDLESWMHTHYRYLWPILAAVGQSNHNEADCVDCYSWSGLSTSYVNSKLKKFGFSRPITSESWHCQHNRKDTWYSDTRRVYYCTDRARYYLAGSVNGKSYLNNTRWNLIRDRWKKRWGMGDPYRITYKEILAKAGRS